LVKAEAPKDSAWFVAGIFFKILPGTGIQEIHQARVTRLVKIVDDLANQKMNIQLSAKVAQFSSGLAIQNSFADAQGAAKARDYAAHGGDFHVAGGIAYQIYVATS
jgi:uncharacterized protein (UPF0303 family)